MLEPDKVIYVDSMFALARAAESGVGIALIPLPISQEWLDNKILVSLHQKQLKTDDYYWISINNNSSQLETARVFAEWLFEKFRKVS